MATTNGRYSRNSYAPLSVQPVKNKPNMLDSPPASPGGTSIRPPTPGGGPLSSHPATSDYMPGAFPPTPGVEQANVPNIYPTDSNNCQASDGAFKKPTSPASATATNLSTPSSEPQRRPSLRKLLSMSSLRSSFSSSRTSLSLPRPSTSSTSQFSPAQENGSQYTTSQCTTSTQGSTPPSAASTTASSQQSRPPLRMKKSGSWFKRKSSMFMTNDDALDVVDENTRPETGESIKRGRESSDRLEWQENKRMRASSPAPSIGAINVSGTGEIGWDEQLFTR